MIKLCKAILFFNNMCLFTDSHWIFTVLQNITYCEKDIHTWKFESVPMSVILVERYWYMSHSNLTPERDRPSKVMNHCPCEEQQSKESIISLWPINHQMAFRNEICFRNIMELQFYLQNLLALSKFLCQILLPLLYSSWLLLVYYCILGTVSAILHL